MSSSSTLFRDLALSKGPCKRKCVVDSGPQGSQDSRTKDARKENFQSCWAQGQQLTTGRPSGSGLLNTRPRACWAPAHLRRVPGHCLPSSGQPGSSLRELHPEMPRASLLKRQRQRQEIPTHTLAIWISQNWGSWDATEACGKVAQILGAWLTGEENM